MPRKGKYSADANLELICPDVDGASADFTAEVGGGSAGVESRRRSALSLKRTNLHPAYKTSPRLVRYNPSDRSTPSEPPELGARPFDFLPGAHVSFSGHRSLE